MSKEEKCSIPSLVPLGIAMDYRVNWNVHHIIRDFVQNFYDSIGCERFADEFQYEWEIEKDRMLHIKMRTFGHSFKHADAACPPYVVPAFRHKQFMNQCCQFLLSMIKSSWRYLYTTEHGLGSGERPSYPELLYVPLSFLSTNNWDFEPGHLSSDFGA